MRFRAGEPFQARPREPVAVPLNHPHSSEPLLTGLHSVVLHRHRFLSILAIRPMRLIP